MKGAQLARRARVRALAKINLDLRVLGAQPDGFHELRTIFQTISLADTIEIAFTPGRKPAIDLRDSARIADNLMVRASHLALEAMRATGRVDAGAPTRESGADEPVSTDIVLPAGEPTIAVRIARLGYGRWSGSATWRARRSLVPCTRWKAAPESELILAVRSDEPRARGPWHLLHRAG